MSINHRSRNLKKRLKRLTSIPGWPEYQDGGECSTTSYRHRTGFPRRRKLSPVLGSRVRIQYQGVQQDYKVRKVKSLTFMPHTSCGQDECTFGKVEVESTGLYLLPHSFDPTGTDSRPRCNIRSPTKQPTVALDDTDTDADARKQMQKNRDKSQIMQIHINL